MPDQIRLDGTVVIVTGAGRGLRRTHAELLAARGATVIVNDRPRPSRTAAPVPTDTFHAISAADGSVLAACEDASIF